MYGDIRTDTSGINGFLIAYLLKILVVAYAIAHYQYGFRLSDLPGISDLPALLNLSVLTQLF